MTALGASEAADEGLVAISAAPAWLELLTDKQGAEDRTEPFTHTAPSLSTTAATPHLSLTAATSHLSLTAATPHLCDSPQPGSCSPPHPRALGSCPVSTPSCRPPFDRRWSPSSPPPATHTSVDLTKNCCCPAGAMLGVPPHSQWLHHMPLARDLQTLSASPA